jgi:hypothetical protein
MGLRGWVLWAGGRCLPFQEFFAIQVLKIVVWQDGDMWLGYLQDYPDYWTQGESLDDLKAHLTDLYADLSTGKIPNARRVEDLIVL